MLANPGKVGNTTSRVGQFLAMTKRGLSGSSAACDRGVSERRLHPRHPAQPELGGKSIVLSAFLKRPREYFGAQLQNISRSGVCLLIDQAFEASQVLRCEILLAELPVRVPTLLQVRWTERLRGTHAYRVGLQFVF